MALSPDNRKFYQSFSEALRQAREGLGLNQGSAAEHAGLSRPSFNKIERGTASVSLHEGLVLMQTFGLRRVADDAWEYSEALVKEERRKYLEAKRAEIDAQIAALARPHADA